MTGSADLVRRTRREVSAICRRSGGLFVGAMVGHVWEKSRFLAPYLRNTLWDCGIALGTVETELPWLHVLEASMAIPESIVEMMPAHDQHVLAFSNLSHVYRDGASVYTTFLFRRTVDPDELFNRWHTMKHAASLMIQEHGGTITHQHGVGLDHAGYLESEKGALGMDSLRSLCKTLDPDGMMNPGKLI